VQRKENTNEMATSERVVFTFDPTSLQTLNHVKEKGDFSSLAMAVRESVQLNDFFQNLVDKGFSEIVVRNPETQQEKTIVISS
jgi:hypothetical protein